MSVSRVENLEVYQRLCALHVEIHAVTRRWPREERFELTSQVRRSSNGCPANLAEKDSDRHMRNRIEGVNRARAEALETVHHLYVGSLKGYLIPQEHHALRAEYERCVRMLNGLERSLEQQLPLQERRWPTIQKQANPRTPEMRKPNPENRKPDAENLGRTDPVSVAPKLAAPRAPENQEPKTENPT